MYKRQELFKTLALPIVLIFLVLGSIFSGIATPTEAAAIGAFGALLIALINSKVNLHFLKETSEKTAIVSTMIFTILIGASIFSLIFRGVGGDELIDLIFNSLPGGSFTALIFVLVVIFLLGFIFFQAGRRQALAGGLGGGAPPEKKSIYFFRRLKRS